MAAGLPCIISDLPALREVYSSAAIFVQSANSEQMAEAVLSLLSNPAKRLELQKKGEKLVNKFSWKEVAMKEFKILQSLSAVKK